MTVYRAHVWAEYGRVHSVVLVGWQIDAGPYADQVIVELPGDAQTHRLVDSHGWYGDRLSAELEVAQKLREMGCGDQAARITEGD